MSATVTQKSQKQHTNAGISEREWVKLFPKQVTENYTNSATFMKQLTAVAVSTITFLKQAFPEDCFTSNDFNGFEIKTLKRKCSDELAQFVSTSLEQAFEAFDKKYIHQLALCFYEGDCAAENLIEYHLFEYTYKQDGVQMSINSKNRNSGRAVTCVLDHVKLKTALFLRTLSMYTYENCTQELPLNYDVSLRLCYNENAPEGYQAPGFRVTTDVDHLGPTAQHAKCMGLVETPYHKLAARSFIRARDLDSDQAVPSDNIPVMTQADNDDFQGSRSSALESVPKMEANIRCPCGKQDLENKTLLTCQYCHMQQHAVCFGFVASISEHCCDVCADVDHSRKPSDPTLVGLDNRRRECLCIFRRTLDICSGLDTIDGVTLMSCIALNTSNVAKMLRLLRSHSILPNTNLDDLKEARKINRIHLDIAINRFFYMQKDNMAERLAAESAESSDPVADVLSPMENIKLHNTSNLGTVIESPPDTNPAVDYDNLTLQQYREAILTHENISEELPLSGSHNPVKDVDKIGKKKLKRKNDSDDEWLPKVPKLRSGAKTKRNKFI